MEAPSNQFLQSGVRVKHVRRGTTYRVIGVASVQASGVIVEGEKLTVYIADSDDSLHARPQQEFEDGRFEAMPDPHEATLAPISDAQILTDIASVLLHFPNHKHDCEMNKTGIPFDDCTCGKASPVIAAARARVPMFEVHIAGPDDVLADEDELSALRRANTINKAYLQDRLANPDNEVMHIATVHEVKS